MQEKGSDIGCLAVRPLRLERRTYGFEVQSSRFLGAFGNGHLRDLTQKPAETLQSVTRSGTRLRGVNRGRESRLSRSHLQKSKGRGGRTHGLG